MGVHKHAHQRMCQRVCVKAYKCEYLYGIEGGMVS